MVVILGGATPGLTARRPALCRRPPTAHPSLVYLHSLDGWHAYAKNNDNELLDLKNVELARKSSCGHKCSGGEIGTPQALHAIDENGLTAVNDSSVLCKQLCFEDIIILEAYLALALAATGRVFVLIHTCDSLLDINSFCYTFL